jgi:hypothetical protein
MCQKPLLGLLICQLVTISWIIPKRPITYSSTTTLKTITLLFVQGVWNGLGQEISEKCFLTSHNFHHGTTPWWTSEFVWILYKGEGEGEEARLDATSSNHLYSVQTKRCQQFSFGLTFWRLFTQCYSDMWAHMSWEFYGTFPIVGLILP